MTITVANGVIADDFTTNTSTNYTSGHNDGGSNGTWTFDTTNKRVTSTGGSDAALAYNGVSLSDMYTEITSDQLDNAGLGVRRSDANNVIVAYFWDSAGTTHQNYFQLYSIAAGNYTLQASGTQAFTRGTVHTIRLEVVRYDVVLYFDGVVIAAIGTTDAAANGTAQLDGGGSGAATTHFLSFKIGDFDNAPKPVPYHYPTDGHCIYEYISPNVGQSVWGPRLDTFAAGGFNLVLNYYLIYDTTANMIAYINYAASKGMKVIIALDRTFLWLSPAIAANVPTMYAESGNQSTDAGFTPYVINQVKNLPGTWGYYVGDEVAASNKAALQTHIGVITGADNTKPTLQIQSDYSDSVHRLTTNWTGCASIVGDDVYPYPDTPNPSVEHVAYGIGKYCAQHALNQAIALQCYSKDNINDPSYSMMLGWLISVYAYMRPRLVLWFAYPDLLASPNASLLWNNLVAAINASYEAYMPVVAIVTARRDGIITVTTRDGRSLTTKTRG